MPSCQAFPERAGPFEREECETGMRGEAVHVSYVAKDDGQLFYMDATEMGHEIGVREMDDWSIDCHAWDPQRDDEWECEFGSASYESFTGDDIPRELKTLGQSIDDDMFDELREQH